MQTRLGLELARSTANTRRRSRPGVSIIACAVAERKTYTIFDILLDVGVCRTVQTCADIGGALCSLVLARLALNTRRLRSLVLICAGTTERARLTGTRREGPGHNYAGCQLRRRRRGGRERRTIHARARVVCGLGSAVLARGASLASAWRLCLVRARGACHARRVAAATVPCVADTHMRRD